MEHAGSLESTKEPLLIICNLTFLPNSFLCFSICSTILFFFYQDENTTFKNVTSLQLNNSLTFSQHLTMGSFFFWPPIEKYYRTWRVQSHAGIHTDNQVGTIQVRSTWITKIEEIETFIHMKVKKIWWLKKLCHIKKDLQERLATFFCVVKPLFCMEFLTALYDPSWSGLVQPGLVASYDKVWLLYLPQTTYCLTQEKLQAHVCFMCACKNFSNKPNAHA